MKKRHIIPLGAIAMVAGIFMACAQTPHLRKLVMAESAINQLYVDTINEEKLVEEAIKGMLKSLDPHSSYTTAEETRDMNEPLQGNFSGVGITYNLTEDTVYVISTVPGGPAQKVGVREGDRILAVNDTNIAGIKIKTRDIQKKLRGPKGTDVRVKVLRREGSAKGDTIHFKITRDDIPINSLDAAYMINDTVGYIRLNKFAAETHNEFADAVKKLKKQGMTALILDLVENGGGYLNAATDILGEILSPGQLAVYTEGDKSSRQNMFAHPGSHTPLLENERLVVMINQYSASAAEITSGAIQDWDRGVIVGRRSYGKGLVQRPIPFPDGSMMRLTVSHYYTPTGRDIQKPYTKGDSKSYAHDMLDRLDSGELMHADSIKYVDSLRVETIRLKRPIYGGGGISPDIFVPLDTTFNTKYYRDLSAKGVLNKYVIRYVDNNRKRLRKEYKTDDKFVDLFTVTDDMLNEIRTMGDAEGVAFSEEQFELSKPLISMIIKGLIGRDVYDQATYFNVYNRWDPIFNRALQTITSSEYDQILTSP